MAMDYVNAASGIRQGLHIQYGPTRIADYQEKEIINRSKIEIKFEIERRKFSKNAVVCRNFCNLDCPVTHPFNLRP